MTEFDLAWLAGLVEGEGCFSYHPPLGGRKAYARVQVSMTDLDVLQRACEASGVGSIHGPYRYKRKNGSPAKPIWGWAVQAQADAWRLIDTLYPHLGERRRARIDEIRVLMFRSDDRPQAASCQ